MLARPDRVRSSFVALPLLFLLGVLFSLQVSAELPTNWVSVFPVGVGQPVYNLHAFRDQVLVARGKQAICSSLDGEYWSRTNMPVTSNSIFLTANGTLYGLAGYDQSTFTSANGLSWRWQASIRPHNWNAAAYGNGLFVAAGTDSLDVSKDAFTWNSRPLLASPLSAGLVFAQDHFVLLSPENGAWLSPDGTNWQSHPVDPIPNSSREASHWGNLRYLNGLCFALGSSPLGRTNGAFAVSGDGGASWTVQKPAGVFTLTDAAYAQGRYVMVGQGVIGYSDDGLRWTFDTQVTSALLVGVVHLQGRFVALDSKGITQYSEDGIRWDSPNHGGDSLYGVTATPSGFNAVGLNGLILSSTNGLDWQRENSGTKEPLVGVDTGGGLIFATGTKGTILTSTTCHDWTQRYSNSANPRLTLRGVTYARGRYVAAGAYLTSIDGLSWRAAGSPVNNVRSLIDDGSQFVAIAYPVYPATHVGVSLSRDGLNSTIKDTGIVYQAMSDNADYGPSLAYGRGIHVFVGDRLIAVSPNGGTWTKYPGLHLLNRVIYAEDGFVAVGESGYLGYSKDGATWTYSQIYGANNLISIAYKDGAYVAVGENGQLFCSLKQVLPRLTPRALLPALGFHMTLRGVAGRSYILQTSDSHGIWHPIGTINTSIPILDPNPTATSLQLYRVVER